MGLIARVLAAAAGSALLTAAATAALYVTTAPKFISLAIEPVCLLLLPGLVVSLAVAGAHDFSPAVVVWVAFAFYFLLLFLALHWRARRQSLAQRTSR